METAHQVALTEATKTVLMSPELMLILTGGFVVLSITVYFLFRR